MKYFKAAAYALGLLLLASCSEKDDYNTASDVTVEMGSAEIKIFESAGTLRVPVVVSGKPNGPVKVTLKVEGTGTNPATLYEDHNGEWYGDYYLTADYLNIPADDKIAYALISLIDNREENEAKTFTISIASADGAEIGAVSSTLVIIKDNDSMPYGKIQGNWNFNFTSYQGTSSTWPVNISGFDEGTEEYDEQLLSLKGLYSSDSDLTLDFIEDETNDKIYVRMVLPEPIALYRSGYLIWVLNGFSLADGYIIGTVNSDYTEITFDPDKTLVFYVASEDFSDALGFVETASAFSLTR